MKKETKVCNCGDSTPNEDGVCDTCRLIDEVEKPTEECKIKYDYDKDNDILFIGIEGEKSEYSIEYSDKLIVDLTDKDEFVGVEIFNIIGKLISDSQQEADNLLLDVLVQCCAVSDDTIDNQCLKDYEDACSYLEKKGTLIKVNDRIYKVKL